MCDFRTIIGVRFEDGTEIECAPAKQGYSWFPQLYEDNPEPGLYHVGQTGCGIYYWDGEQVHSDYGYDDFTRCTFIVDEDNPNISNFMFLSDPRWPGYQVKYDGLRKSNRWTALGPEGRLGDVNTKKEVWDLVKEDYDKTQSDQRK